MEQHTAYVILYNYLSNPKRHFEFTESGRCQAKHWAEALSIIFDKPFRVSFLRGRILNERYYVVSG